jgi:hypothetical protein
MEFRQGGRTLPDEMPNVTSSLQACRRYFRCSPNSGHIAPQTSILGRLRFKRRLQIDRRQRLLLLRG